MALHRFKFEIRCRQSIACQSTPGLLQQLTSMDKWHPRQSQPFLAGCTPTPSYTQTAICCPRDRSASQQSCSLPGIAGLLLHPAQRKPATGHLCNIHIAIHLPVPFHKLSWSPLKGPEATTLPWVRHQKHARMHLTPTNLCLLPQRSSQQQTECIKQLFCTAPTASILPAPPHPWMSLSSQLIQVAAPTA